MSKHKTVVFSKPDEMELRLRYRSMWVALVVVHLVWGLSALYAFVMNGNNLISGNTLFAIDVLYGAILLFSKWSMTRGGSDH